MTFDPSPEAKGGSAHDLESETPENDAAAAGNLLVKAGMSEDSLQALTALLKKGL